MQGELKARLTELERLNRKGIISDDEYKQALAERRGGVLVGNRLRRQPLGMSVVVEKRDATGAKTTVERRAGIRPQPTTVSRLHGVHAKAEQVYPTADVRGRDALIRLDRQLVKDGFRSMLVKVVKRERPQTAIVIASGGIMEQIKAAMSGE